MKVRLVYLGLAILNIGIGVAMLRDLAQGRVR